MADDVGERREAAVPGARIARPPVHRITLAQFAILLPLSVSLVVVDEVCAYSAALGGLIAILPQAWFARQVFRWRGGRAARAVVQASYAGEVSKFLLSAAGFAAVFILVRPINGPAVFAGFLAMLAVQLVGGWLLLRRSR